MAATLRHVDPPRQASLFAKIYAALAATRVAKFISRHLNWKLDPLLPAAHPRAPGLNTGVPDCSAGDTRCPNRRPQVQRHHLLPRWRADHRRGFQRRQRKPPSLLSQPAGVSRGRVRWHAYARRRHQRPERASKALGDHRSSLSRLRDLSASSHHEGPNHSADTTHVAQLSRTPLAEALA